MSTNAKIVTWIVVAVVVVGGGIWWYLSAAPTAIAPAGYGNNPTSTTAMATSTTNNTNNNGVSATDTSNAALQADLTTVDSQTNSFSGDNASMTQGMNDQETQQSSF